MWPACHRTVVVAVFTWEKMGSQKVEVDKIQWLRQSLSWVSEPEYTYRREIQTPVISIFDAYSLIWFLENWVTGLDEDDPAIWAPSVEEKVTFQVETNWKQQQFPLWQTSRAC